MVPVLRKPDWAHLHVCIRKSVTKAPIFLQRASIIVRWPNRDLGGRAQICVPASRWSTKSIEEAYVHLAIVYLLCLHSMVRCYYIYYMFKSDT